jgi:glutamate dehydrogenase (NAD(P)+)
MEARMDEVSSFNPFAEAQAQFDRIADLMALDPPTRALLRQPAHEHRLTLPVRLDDGTVEVFDGFRVQHNDARGPAWGGVRFHPQETIDTIRALAMWTTWKTALVDIPLGGSMGGVICDPHRLSTSEVERICRAWIRRVGRTIGPHRDVPAPDIMTSGQHMTWMLDEFETIAGERTPGAITGKTLGAGGSLGRQQAAGYGLVYILRESLKEAGIDARKTTASVQGFGTVARHAIELFTQIGGTVTCVASWDPRVGEAAAFRKADGVDLDELTRASDRLGNIEPNAARNLGYEVLEGDAWLEQEVDVLIPAALEHQITESNVERVASSVRLVLEGANGPTSPAAERALLDREILLIPDLLANAGGVICAYFEQVQSNMNYYWPLSEVLGKLDRKLTASYIEISDLARSKTLPMRDAALVTAIDRVASMCRERGWL